MAYEIKPLGDILKMSQKDQQQEMLGMIYDMHTEIRGLPCRIDGSCQPSRWRRISVISAIGVFAGSSVIGLIMGIINVVSK